MRSICLKNIKNVNHDIDCLNCEMSPRCYKKQKKHLLRKFDKILTKKVNSNYVGGMNYAGQREE
jgi:hypothetical protein